MLETTTDRPFAACAPQFIRDAACRLLAFRRLPREAEIDVRIAIDRVPPDGQMLLIDCAADACVPERAAMDRLSCIWMMGAAVNLADDIADDDCDYLDARVAPGVLFLLQSLATVAAVRGRVSPGAFDASAVAMTRAAAGQSLEVRAKDWTADRYVRVAELIAGQQYVAYMTLLWDGTPLEGRAPEIGSALGTVGIVLTDILSGDERFIGMPPLDIERVLSLCRDRLTVIDEHDLPALRRFTEFARPILERFSS